MINISSIDINKFDRIGSGKFGIVYKVDDDYAYKIYHKSLYDFNGYLISNPCLRFYKTRLNRLIRKRNEIHNTGLPDDFVFIDGNFGGIRIPYYDGDTLFNLSNISYNLKYDISKQLVINSKELTDKNIYPQDYKLNNIIYTKDDKVRIVDLDDFHTKVTLIDCNYYKNNSIIGINDTIRSFFNEFDYLPYGSDVSDRLLVDKGCFTNNYDDINRYLDNKNISRNFIIVDSNSSIDTLIEFLNYNDYNVIFLYDSKLYDNEYFLNKLDLYESFDINLYDYLCIYDVDRYFENTNTCDVLKLVDKQLIKKK